MKSFSKCQKQKSIHIKYYLVKGDEKNFKTFWCLQNRYSPSFSIETSQLFHRGKDGWVMIDTGLDKKETYEIWKEFLSQNHIKFQDIKQIFLTHRHPDHCGFSNELQRITGANIYMSKADWEVFQSAWNDTAANKARTFYESYGVDSQSISKMEENRQKIQQWVKPLSSVSFIEEGDQFKIGDLIYRAIHTPGHSEGHFSLYNDDQKIIFIGDHVLPRITPNISVYHNTSSNPLKLYLDSLENMKKLDVSLAIPSHGEAFYNFHNRIDEIIHHHHLRFEQIADSLSHFNDINNITRYIFKDRLTPKDLHFAIGEM